MSRAPGEWSASTPQPHRPTATRIPVAEADLPALNNVEVTVRFSWSDTGLVTLDVGGKVALRLDAALRAHLAAGGVARLAVSSEAELILPGVGHPLQLDLSRKAGRLLAESAGLVLAQVTDDADIDNIG